MELETPDPPPPFMENSIKNFHFVFLVNLTLSTPAYLSISKNRRGAHCVPPKYLEVGWVRVPIFLEISYQ